MPTIGAPYHPAAAAATIEGVFADFAPLVVICAYWRGATHGADPRVLVFAIPARRVDGITVLPNDDMAFFPAIDLAGVTQPRPGDYFIDPAGLRRDVITAHLHTTLAYWKMVARKVF